MEDYSFYLFLCVLHGSDFHVCRVWSFMSSVLSLIILEKSIVEVEVFDRFGMK